MYKRTKFILLIILLPFLAFNQEKIALSGRVLEGLTHNRMENVQIERVDKNHFELIGTTDSLGIFKIRFPLKSKLRFRYSGYYDKIIDSDKFNANELITIHMNSMGGKIDTVSVKIDYKIKTEVDRLVYIAKNDVNSARSNGLEIMSKLPLLEVLSNDKIYFNGKENYTILVNGKKNLAASTNLSSYLESLNGDQIKRIELINSSSAKYDAEGSGQVINIILADPPMNGYNLSTSFRAQSLGFVSGSINADIRHKFVQLGIYINNSLQEFPYSKSRRTVHNDSELIHLNSSFKNKFITQNYGFDATLKLDSLNTLGFNSGLNYSKFNSIFHQEISNLQNTRKEDDKNSKLIGINYQHNFKYKKDKYYFVAYQFRNNSEHLKNFFENSLQNINSSEFKEHSTQFDFAIPRFISKIDIEFGTKMIFRTNAANGLDYLSNDNFVRRLDHNQNIYATYISSLFSINNFSVKAGLRSENTFVKQNNRENTEDINILDKKYMNILPSINALYRFSRNRTISTSFNIQISRPSIFQLNPAKEVYDNNSYIIGNPDLQPVKNHNFEFAFSKFHKFNYRIAYRLSYSQDEIQSIVKLLDSNIFEYTYGNISGGLENEINLYASKSFLKDKLDISLNSRVTKVNLMGYINTSLVNKSNVVFGINSNGGFNFPNGHRISYYINLVSPRITLQSKSTMFLSSSIGYSKTFKSNLRLNFTIYNPFQANLEQKTSYKMNSGQIQTFRTIVPYRNFELRLTYSLKKLKRQINGTDKSIENNDLNNIKI
ncbi:outer membrane beta-barrel family protein [Sphingobacterium sp.]|uniref:outer membrane beta-barrel family protein n=1 Tax=Sphingobacterium sp. TaxID=341027 RepID=UPI0028AF450F|nr:outer membrane beta-barrel family protein [Sphingobacterium sp.]